MRWAVAAILLALSVADLSWHSAVAQEQKSKGNRGEGTEVSTRLADTLRLTNAKGVVVPVHVEFKEWHITRSARGTEFPEQGFYIAHLLSGLIITEIAGKSVPHGPGDFWIVGKGTRMVVTMEAHREAAIIQTLSISPPH